MDDGLSQITLHRIEVNDVTLTHLHIRDTQSSNFGIGTGTFNSEDNRDFYKLGVAIGKYTHLTSLDVMIEHITLDDLGGKFYAGLKQNSSIYELTILDAHGIDSIIGGAD